MAAQSSIDRHPDRERIVELIASGMPGAEIARRYSVSESAISRWRSSRMQVLNQIITDDGTDPTEIMGRLADLADSARVTRKLADASSSPQVRARAIAAELSVLDRLAKLGVDDTSTTRLNQALGPLVRTVQTLYRRFPSEVLSALAEHEELHELRQSLQAQKKKPVTQVTETDAES
ncbi:DNA-binding NarL/FixJ family response regulator [Microbacterium ginsengiterrae]|uniref:DNA-binding NarL/FixJ family response regulator n=1 Tax=Microbacterium ginsengiterrae TaxID=546115 RepID=A0A7W9CAQ1_9MICO|nr:helix-turn-helix domain-containing protein [Microbacterium ginsengiterrae]MBB5741707.1 DNA-binding NarL/FixJ family response regulator [Microbacterium ginsengiterrae]